jgi:hypothetical protein
MPTREDLDLENKNSLSNQRATRSRRRTIKAMKDKMNAALRGATSTKERREIKSKFNVDTNKASDQTDNQQGVNEDSNQRGDDNFKPSYDTLGNDSSGGGGGEAIFPFQIVQIDSDTIAIRKGTVSTIIPTIGGTPLDDDYTLNTIDVAAATTFWLDATVNASEVITAVAIVTSDPGADTSTQTKQQLGSLTWDTGAIDAISSNLGGSQNVDSCGASHSWNRI